MICSHCEAYTTKPEPFCPNCGRPFWRIISQMLANCLKNEVSQAEAITATRVYDQAVSREQ